MAKLIYSAIASLDGYVSDSTGNFDWAAPDEEVLAFVNDIERPIGTYLYGRRMYETMVFWDSAGADLSPLEQEFTQLWQAADKIVYSRSLESVSSRRTRLEPEFDAGSVRAFLQSQERDVSVGGPALAGEALRAGLVDECQLFLNPVTVGDGNAVLPRDLRIELELLNQHRFANGVVYLRYSVVK